ncbi:MAG: hypothetical protein JSW11_02770 [Candidatus Heimdallarchaeota archaeon]|nr:MAG: hypothetical protein JSW11_02770 [Candidatus Heimdallarchaeota archaeon]
MSIKTISILLIAIFSIVIQLDHPYTFSIPLNDPLGYKVNVGDFREFKYTKFYDSRLPDPSKDRRYARNVDGELQNFTIEEGVKLKITITDVGESYISGTRTIEDAVTIEEDWMDLFVRPMTDNISLLAKSFNESGNFKIQNNHIIEEVDEPYSPEIYYDLNRSRTSIWEKTGWVSYFLIRVYDAETVYYELEVVEQPSHSEIVKSNEISGVFLLSIILIVVVYLQFASKRK